MAHLKLKFCFRFTFKHEEAWTLDPHMGFIKNQKKKRGGGKDEEIISPVAEDDFIFISLFLLIKSKTVMKRRSFRKAQIVAMTEGCYSSFGGQPFK